MCAPVSLTDYASLDTCRILSKEIILLILAHNGMWDELGAGEGMELKAGSNEAIVLNGFLTCPSRFILCPPTCLGPLEADFYRSIS